MKSKLSIGLVIFILLVPFIYLFIVFDGLPERVPMHYNFKGEVDRYGDKTELIFSTGLLSIIGLGVYLLMLNIHKIDPKKTAAQGRENLVRIGVASAVLISVINFVIINAAASDDLFNPKNLFVAIGLFFAFLGNEMYRIKPNYFVGIRTPWALQDDYNWRKTHQLGGRLFFAGGILIVLTSLLLEKSVAFTVFISIVVLSAIIPFIYSFKLYKNRQQ